MLDFRSPQTLPKPFGYSHSVSIPAGRLVLTSGQVGMRPDGTIPEGWMAQTRLAFENVGHALRAAGADWPDVVKLTYFVTGVDELPLVRSVRDEFVDVQRPPASSLVEVAGLFLPELLIEIEAIASPVAEASPR
jgi:enamine deaminase RidA (YjgF/YER057c/UK114 family)